MKMSVLNILMITAFILFISISYASDRITKTYNYKDFSAVDVSSGMHLKVTQSDSFSIEVIADQDDFKYLRVEKDGNSLKLYIKRDSFFFDWGRHNKIEVNIKMPSLIRLELSGGSIGNINMDVSTTKFSAELSGGSSINGNLKCGKIEMELSGGSVAELYGQGKNLKVDGSGGSIFKLKNFEVNDVDADLSGGSVVEITMNGALNTEQSGGSHLTYFGKASLGNTDFSGGSGISKGR
ncbi:MAG: head GIN domain-containing protein [Ignavibacteriaceae bacterium]